MNFKIGDRVRLSASSEYFTTDNSDYRNPTDVAGTIVTNSDITEIVVLWDKGIYESVDNIYNAKDLVLMEYETAPLLSWKEIGKPFTVSTKTGKIRWNKKEGGIGSFDIGALAQRVGQENLERVAALIMHYSEVMANGEKSD